MSRVKISTEAAPKAIGPYSQGVASTPGKIIFCSGQIPLNAASGELTGPTDIRSQTLQVIQNLQAVLLAGGASLQNVVKTTIFLTDLANFGIVNEVYGSFFSNDPPARSTVQVVALPRGAQVEIEAIAVVE